jgi:hypothetical protein
MKSIIILIFLLIALTCFLYLFLCGIFEIIIVLKRLMIWVAERIHEFLCGKEAE